MLKHISNSYPGWLVQAETNVYRAVNINTDWDLNFILHSFNNYLFSVYYIPVIV